MLTRGITKDDYDEITQVMDHWWGGPVGIQPLPIFFYEWGDDALIVEESGQMVGFLIGFLTQRPPRVAYVHLVGIHPQFRRRGVGKALYEEFARRGEDQGATSIKAITSPGNQGSVEFHRALGFKIEEVQDYAGPGRARFVFTRALTRPRSN